MSGSAAGVSQRRPPAGTNSAARDGCLPRPFGPLDGTQVPSEGDRWLFSVRDRTEDPHVGAGAGRPVRACTSEAGCGRAACGGRSGRDAPDACLRRIGLCRCRTRPRGPPAAAARVGDHARYRTGARAAALRRPGVRRRPPRRGRGRGAPAGRSAGDAAPGGRATAHARSPRSMPGSSAAARHPPSWRRRAPRCPTWWSAARAVTGPWPAW